MLSETKHPCIAILSFNEEEQAVIAEATRSYNIEPIFASTIHDLRNIILEKPCCGILLFIASLIGMDQSERSIIQVIEKVYPAARIRWHKTNSAFALIGSRSKGLETLTDFFGICGRFSPRCLRRNERSLKTLNILLSETSDFSRADRTFTTNISLSGCFLYSPREWNPGDSIFMQIQELQERITLHGKVIRCVPWGVHFNVQGIGVQFMEMDKHQVEALQHLLHQEE
jgi:Tfp pilus assembly protein PilZ